jgi:hypothetical protein
MGAIIIMIRCTKTTWLSQTRVDSSSHGAQIRPAV